MEYLLKASAVIAIFYACYKICLQRDTFFEQNRLFLLTGLISAIFIPLIVIPVYIEQPTINLENYILAENVSNPNTVSDSINPLSILNKIYLLGVIIFSIRFLLQISSLTSMIANSKSYKKEDFKFIKTNKAISPFSFFNYIVYNPDQFSETELDQIIMHEKVHARQFHTLDVLLVQFACIVFWFNPFIWLYNKALKQNLEFIADKTAINFANCKKSYQYTLLKTSMPTHQLVLTNNFYNSLIKKRIVMLHKSKSKKINLLKFTFIIPALAMFLMSFNTEKVFLKKEKSNIESSSAENLKVQDSYKVMITKDSSKEDLEKIIEEAKGKGVTLKFKDIKRNSKNEITAISASFKNEKGSGNYNLNGDEPIKSFVYYQNVDSFGFSSISKKSESKQMVFISKDGEKHKLNDSDENVFVFSSDDNNSDDSEIKTFIIKEGDTSKITKKHKLKVIHFSKDKDTIVVNRNNDKKVYKVTVKSDKNDDNLTWTTEEDEDLVFIAKDDNAVKKHKTVKVITNDKEPLYILDGKEISKEEMKEIKPENIESVEVLKDTNATEKYGKKGKDGVIIITTKKN